MVYYRCKCGKSQAWGGLMPPNQCTGCPECGTTLEVHPSLRKSPKPHEFVVRYNETTGEPYEMCVNCLRRKNELVEQ